MHSGKLLIGIGATFLVGCATELPIDFDVACRPRTTVLHHDVDRIQIDHPIIDVCSGQTITIQTARPVAANRAHSRPKSASATNPFVDDTPTGRVGTGNPGWLEGDAGPNGRIEINVPKGTPLGIYGYTLSIDGAGSLDPYVRVIM